MKKAFLATILVLMIALLAVGPAWAQKGKINIKGEVTAVSGDTITVQSNKGVTYIVTVPEGFVVSTIEVGDSVLIKATAGENGAWLAQSIKKVGSGDGENEVENEDEEEVTEGFKDNSAFCAEGKKDGPHPLAPKLAERYGVSEEWVMEKFCEGYSIGAIMLAIKTSQIEDMTSTPDELLASRATGSGWGQIWQGLGLIGSEKDGHSPPGLLKKPDHAGPKNKN